MTRSALAALLFCACGPALPPPACEKLDGTYQAEAHLRSSKGSCGFLLQQAWGPVHFTEGVFDSPFPALVSCETDVCAPRVVCTGLGLVGIWVPGLAFVSGAGCVGTYDVTMEAARP